MQSPLTPFISLKMYVSKFKCRMFALRSRRRKFLCKFHQLFFYPTFEIAKINSLDALLPPIKTFHNVFKFVFVAISAVSDGHTTSCRQACRLFLLIILTNLLRYASVGKSAKLAYILGFDHIVLRMILRSGSVGYFI